MTTSPANPGSRQSRSAGFTMVEVLIAATLSTILLAGVLSTFLMLSSSGMRLANYSMMESQTRRAFEQLGIDARMASDFTADTFSGSDLTAFTLTLPAQDLSDPTYVTYGFFGTAGNYTFYSIPGKAPATGPATPGSGQLDLITSVASMQILRYDSTYTPITSTSGSPGIKHIQISVNVSRGSTGVVTATQVIRSSAFTIRNISL